MATHKLTICVPNMGSVCTSLALWLALRVADGANVFAPMNIRPVSRARNLCVAAFLQGGDERMLFVDADTTPMAGTLEMLLGSGHRAVSGSVRAMKPFTDGSIRPRAMIMHENPGGGAIMIEPDIHGVIPIDLCGAAFFLLHRSLLESLDPPWFEDMNVQDDEPCGEDWNFCRRIRREGVQLYAHTDARATHQKETTF